MDIRKNLLNSYTIPNRKMKLFTYNFLKRLRNELLEYRIDEKDSYYGFYLQMEGTINYYSALRTTCEEFNVKNAIYDYVLKLPEEKADLFNDFIIRSMVKRGLIDEGNIYDGIPDYSNSSDEFVYINTVKECKNYNVIVGEWRLKEKEIIQ